MTKSERDELRRLAEKATPGPWFQLSTSSEGNAIIVWKCEPRIGNVSELLADSLNKDNTEFIATFNPKLVLSLLNSIDELERKVEKYRTALETIANKKYMTVALYSRTHENPYGDMVEDLTARKALEE